MASLTVYVPAVPQAIIEPGSGIVGESEAGPDGRITIDYEGNLYGSAPTYYDKLRTAAGRHVSRYPTRARSRVPIDWLIEVGTFDPESRVFTITNDEALSAWRGADIPII